MAHPLLAYIVLNIDPILLRLGNLAVHWYGLAYVVAICAGLWVALRWARHEGIHDDQTWALFLWTALAGLIGGRLYFVIQQPNLVSQYLLDPINIVAVWNGGMAFFGAIFLGGATLFALGPRYGINRFLALDAGAVFAMIGQIFGRFGNIINGDILGYAQSRGPISVPVGVCAHAPCLAYVADGRFLPWAVVYLNPHSFAPLGIPFQPAPVYEMLCNIVALAILWPLRYRLPKRLPGLFFALYAALYATGQFIVFFFRGSEPYTPFLGIATLKQAQWTAIFTFALALLFVAVVLRFSTRWPYSAKAPVPWSPALADAAAAGTLAREARAATAPRVPVAVAVSSRAAGMAGMAAVAGTAATAATTRARLPAADLAPWQPTHATHGQLRNVFAAQAVRRTGTGE